MRFNRTTVRSRLAFVGAVMGVGASALLTGAPPAQAQNPTRFNVAPPELVGGAWLNTPEKAPLTLASRRGQVTILHFWTFG